MGVSHSELMGACAYYFRAVGRNRVAQLFDRLTRDPAQAGAVVIVPLATIVLATSLIGAGQRFHIDLRPWLVMFVALQVAVIWIGLPLQRRLWKQQLGLSYGDAEVEWLFQAPLGRVPLRLFKLAQKQSAVVTSALAYAILSAGTPDFNLIRLFLGWMLVVNIIMIHSHLVGSLGGYFVLRRRAWLGWLIAGLSLAAIGYLCRAVIQELEAHSVGGLLSSPSFRSWLAPFAALLAPAYSLSWGAFLGSLWIPMGALALHVVLLMAVDPGLEEGMATAESERQVRGSRILWLAATGPRWWAFVWKNMIARMRGRSAFENYAMLFAAAWILAVVFAPEDYRVLAQFLTMCFFVVFNAYAALVAPSAQPPGLRLDIQHSDVLRAMPVRARELVFGAIVGPFLVLYGAVLVVFGTWALLYNGTLGDPISWAGKLKAAALLLPFMLSWIFTQIVIQNLMLLYAPLFAGAGSTRGDEQQNFGPYLLGFVARLAVLLLLALPAAGAGYLAFLVAYHSLGVDRLWCWRVAVDLGSAILLGEALLLIYLAAPRYRELDLPATR